MKRCKPIRKPGNSSLILTCLGVQSYKEFFKETTKKLQDEGVPNHILERLELLEEQVFTEEAELLSAVEKLIGEEPTMRYAELIIKHIEYNVGTISVWSRIERSEESSESTTQSVVYQITTYQPVEGQIVMVEKIEGTYQQTSEILQAVLQERRTHEKAPTPLLLNFLKRAPKYLCEEEEWFRYLEGWE